MADSISVDAHELDDLAAQFAAAGAKIIPALIPVAHRAGANIKRVMRSDASGHRHLPGLAGTVGYDVDVSTSSITTDVGFNKVGQGRLGNIAAYGSVHNAPVMDITRGLNAEVPNFMAWCARVAAQVLS